MPSSDILYLQYINYVDGIRMLGTETLALRVGTVAQKMQIKRRREGQKTLARWCWREAKYLAHFPASMFRYDSFFFSQISEC